MPIQFITTAGTLKIPGAYVTETVQNSPSALSVNGVLFVVGEADAGPRFSEENPLRLNAFGPDQATDVQAKYGSGPLVDAVRGAVAASNDPNIVGSFTKIIPVKTNASIKAGGFLPAIGGGNYAALAARSAGAAGNLISRSVAQKTAEILPSTGPCYIAPPQLSTDIEFRVNGGAATDVTLSTGELPSAIVTAINGLSGVAATGGTNRAVIASVAGTLTMTLDSGFQCHVVISTAWSVNPTVGDLVYIPTGSPFSAANEGSYVVTASSNTRIDMYKILDAAGSGAARTAPTGEGPVSIAATTDLQAFAPVVITLEAGLVVPGLGKSLEFANSGSASIANNVFVAATSPPAIAATFVSTSATPVVIKAGAEYAVSITDSRQADSINETITPPSGVVLNLGYKGTTGSAVIAAGVMTITVTGGAGVSPAAITLSSYPTINDLVSYINTLTGFTASAESAALGQFATTDLDPGTYGIGSAQGAKVGRIKQDGARFQAAYNSSSVLLQVAPIGPATQLVGLPDVSSLAFLTGGSRGGTSNADISAALDALQKVSGNFPVTLFSQDATVDIANGNTDPSSTYDIDSVNALLKSHVLFCSQLLQRKPRQGFASHRGTFAAAMNAAGQMATSRVSMCFQDVKDINSTGTIVQFQPWMLAVKAASMQAAGFYRPIFNKFINCSGVLQAANDWDDQSISDETNAIDAGLLFATNDDAGGTRWVVDQTTYTASDNFVFNSVQAVYAGDTIGQTVGQRMERSFVGQSTADVPAALALSTLESILNDMLRLKLIAPSDDAPSGYKSATVRKSGPVLACAAELKLSTGIYFIPINFLISSVQQSAG